MFCLLQSSDPLLTLSIPAHAFSTIVIIHCFLQCTPMFLLKRLTSFNVIMYCTQSSYRHPINCTKYILSLRYIITRKHYFQMSCHSPSPSSPTLKPIGHMLFRASSLYSITLRRDDVQISQIACRPQILVPSSIYTPLHLVDPVHEITSTIYLLPVPSIFCFCTSEVMQITATHSQSATPCRIRNSSRNQHELNSLPKCTTRVVAVLSLNACMYPMKLFRSWSKLSFQYKCIHPTPSHSISNLQYTLNVLTFHPMISLFHVPFFTARMEGHTIIHRCQWKLLF